MFEWTYSGVNASIPGNGGEECAQFLTPLRRTVETFITLAFASSLVLWGYKNISLPENQKCVPRYSWGRRALLVLLSAIWGIEIGFKLASQTVIYLLNPCHVTTAIQIYLLTAHPSRLVTAMFRLHLSALNGAVLAFVFPVTESRVLPFETSIYWIQHSMMLVVPYYLLRLGGVYNFERLTDMSWCAMSLGINLLYHFVILQGIAIPSQVNLNHMLCPTLLDPFYGPLYRTAAVVHQSLLCPLTCKTYCIVASFILTKFPPGKGRDNHVMDLDELSGECTCAIHPGANGGPCAIKNGHLHRD